MKVEDCFGTFFYLSFFSATEVVGGKLVFPARVMKTGRLGLPETLKSVHVIFFELSR